jgi:hypothetical protein
VSEAHREVGDFIADQDQALAVAAAMLANKPATFVLLVAEGTAEEIDAGVAQVLEGESTGEASMGYVSFGNQTMLLLLVAAAKNIIQEDVAVLLDE